MNAGRTGKFQPGDAEILWLIGTLVGARDSSRKKGTMTQLNRESIARRRSDRERRGCPRKQIAPQPQPVV